MRGYLFKMILLAENQNLSKQFIAEICRINGISPPSSIGVEFYVSNMNLKPPNEEQARITFQIWRILNTPRINLLRTNLYLGARGALLILDLTKRSELLHLPNHIQELRAQNPDLAIILVGYHSEYGEDRQITVEECSEFASAHHLTYVENNIVKVAEIFQLLGYQMTRLPVPNNLEELIEQSYRSSIADLVIKLQQGESLNDRQIEFFQAFATFKERILLEQYLPADHSILALFHQKFQIINQMGFNLLL